jgi:uncharacterized membrane protein
MDLMLHVDWPIQLHLVLGLLAMGVGAFQLLSAKGGTMHRTLGWLWVALMFSLCTVSFGIHQLMPSGILAGFSPIHLLSLYVMVQLFKGVRLARLHLMQAHAKCMKRMYWSGLCLAGVFTLYPGRLLYQVMVAPWVAQFM